MLLKALVKKSAQPKLLQQLSWPLKREEVKDACSALHECMETFNFCLTIANWYVARRPSGFDTKCSPSVSKIMARSGTQLLSELQSQTERIKRVQSAVQHAENEVMSVSAKIDRLHLEQRSKIPKDGSIGYLGLLIS